MLPLLLLLVFWPTTDPVAAANSAQAASSAGAAPAINLFFMMSPPLSVPLVEMPGGAARTARPTFQCLSGARAAAILKRTEAVARFPDFRELALDEGAHAG